MSKNKTDKSKYKSKYSGEYCTARQYICDLLMERKYKNTKLPFKYWSEPKYKKEYIKNLQSVNKICKLYDDELVLETIIENSWLYSVFYPKFTELLEKQEKKREKLEKSSEDYTAPSESSIYDGTNKKTRVISKFKSLDD